MSVQKYIIPLVSDFENTQRSLSNQEKENLKLSDQVEETSSNIRLLKDRIYVLRNDSIQNGNTKIITRLNLTN